MALAVLLCAARPGWAHHSYAAFDTKRRLLVKGTVKEFEWASPHCWIRLLVPTSSGGMSQWNVEAGTPNVDARHGWSPHSMQPGDQVAVILYPARDGSTTGSVVSVTLADGRTLTR